MYLTKEQLAKLLAIIDEIHHVFIANYLTPAVLPREVVGRLKRTGVVIPKVQGVRDAYRYGLLAANLPASEQGEAGPTFEQVKAKLKRDPMPLSRVERQAIRTAEMMAGRYISGLGERIKTDVTRRVMESDKRSRAADRTAYKETIAHGIEQRRSNRQVASDLGHKTQDWTRDMERVANTELSDAMQQGTAQEAAKRGGRQARVAKVFANKCCEYCRRLYGAGDGTDRPRIFALEELEANGTNVGRKAREWLPVIGPMHPNCFAGETRYITSEGVRTFESTVGQSVRVLSRRQSYTDATIRAFGRQRVWKLHLRCLNARKTIIVTPDHRWFRYRGLGRMKEISEVTTRDLKPEDRLVQCHNRIPSSVHPSPFGAAHGIVFGDGTCPSAEKRPSAAAWVTLCGDKNAELLRFFPNCPQSVVPGVGINVFGLPRAFKAAPNLQEHTGYLYGWLAGYFAADGSCKPSGNIQLYSSKREHLELAAEVARRVGISTRPIATATRVGIDGAPSELHTLPFLGHTLREDFFILSHHRATFLSRPNAKSAGWTVVGVEQGDEEREVYCAVVPDGEAFALEGNILTGNCRCTLVFVPRAMAFNSAGLMVPRSLADT